MPDGDGDEEKLSKFFGLIKYFNEKEELNKELKTQIEEYFQYRWSHDKNMTQDSALHETIFREMPEEEQD